MSATLALALAGLGFLGACLILLAEWRQSRETERRLRAASERWDLFHHDPSDDGA